MPNQNDRRNPNHSNAVNPRRLSFYADQHKTNEIIDDDACYQANSFEEPNNNDTCRIKDDNNQHIQYEAQTLPDSNITHGSEEPSVDSYHDAFYNDDWNNQ